MKNSLLVLVLLALPALAVDGPDPSGETGFERAVSQVSRALGKSPLQLPLGAIASFASSFTGSFGAEDLQLAVFQKARLDNPLELTGVGSPAISVTTAGKDSVRLYTRPDGNWIRLVILVANSDDTVVASMRLRPDRLAALAREMQRR